jgi:TPR repeat protein
VEAVRWYRLAAEQGNMNAQFNLGAKYDNGEGVPQNYAEAVKWYRLAAEQGNFVAQNQLGIMYANGNGVPQNYVEAYKWSALAAAKNAFFAEARDAVRRRMTPSQVAEGQKLAAEWKPKE